MPKNYLSTTRRGFLGATAAVSAFAATGIPDPAHSQNQPPLDQYSPKYFSDLEWAFVLAVTARIIPSDGDGPGALDARVPVFIDRQMTGDFGTAANLYMEGPFVPDAPDELGMQSPLTPAEIYRGGIAAVDAWVQDKHTMSFADLEPAAQDEVLTALSKKEVPLDPKLKEFWPLLLQNTREGYFADPMYGGNAGMASWVYIGFPGARANFTEWVGREEAYPLGPVSISGERA